MDATSKTALVIALVAVALLLLLFGGGIATDRDQWRDDGQRKRGHDLDVASHLVCRRARRRAFSNIPERDRAHSRIDGSQGEPSWTCCFALEASAGYRWSPVTET